MIKIIRAVTVAKSLDFCSGIMRHLSAKYEMVALSSPGTEMEAFRQSEEVRCIAVDMQRHISPIKDLQSLFKLIRVLHKERPTMVHSMTPKAGMLCMLAAWINRVPVRVHTFTGLVFPTSTGLRRKILMFTDWLTCACATHIIPEGEGVKRDLLTHHITNKPMRVLGHGNVRGIDLEHFHRTAAVMTQAATIRKQGMFTFIAIGRLVGDKGINELVAAFQRLQQEQRDTSSHIRLLLVGTYEADLDPLTPETLETIKTNPAIEATGKQTDVRPWLAASDCAVLASYREGFPNVVIEAGAMGLPQIVTDINGANEIIIEGKNGTIVPSKNVDALYAAMKRMTADAAWRESLAANARTMIASRYEQSYVRSCLYEYYDEILSPYQ